MPGQLDKLKTETQLSERKFRERGHGACNKVYAQVHLQVLQQKANSTLEVLKRLEHAAWSGATRAACRYSVYDTDVVPGP